MNGQAMSDDPSSEELQAAKQVVLDFHKALDAAADDDLVDVLGAHTSPDWHWRGMRPFYEQHGAKAVANSFWLPLRAAFSPIQRRADIFLAGPNNAARIDGAGREGAGREGTRGENVWVCQMGHLLGLFDAPWLNIPPTHKMVSIRYAEFNRVHAGVIVESAMFIDIISVMRQAGHYPLPPQTGASLIYPGPLTHDGLLLDTQPPGEGTKTMALVNKMIDDLSESNRIAAETGSDRVPREVLAESWHEDMIWSGPEGIGATYTIDRYQQQHQYPFRFGLAGKTFNGHIARFAEGDYACFFGWPNLTNSGTGGFLGMTGNNTPADMRVVDVYRRDGHKLAENWVFIDLLHWLSMQGLDLLERMRQLTGQEDF